MLQSNIGKPLEINAYQSKISEQRDTRSFDSLSLSVNFSLGWRLYMARQYDQAISQLLNTIEMDPT